MTVLAYDFHGVWNNYLSHHQALLTPFNSDKMSQDKAIKFWIDNGLPKEKFIIGISLYARSFTYMHDDGNRVGSDSFGAGVAGDYTNTKGFLAYYEVR